MRGDAECAQLAAAQTGPHDVTNAQGGENEKGDLPCANHSAAVIKASHWNLGQRCLYCENAKELLFTNNETNTERLFGVRNQSNYVKDGINDYIINGDRSAVSPDRLGTKAAAHYELPLGPGETKMIRLRFSEDSPAADTRLFGNPFGQIMAQRSEEADT